MLERRNRRKPQRPPGGDHWKSSVSSWRVLEFIKRVRLFFLACLLVTRYHVPFDRWSKRRMVAMAEAFEGGSGKSYFWKENTTQLIMCSLPLFLVGEKTLEIQNTVLKKNFSLWKRKPSWAQVSSIAWGRITVIVFPVGSLWIIHCATPTALWWGTLCVNPPGFPIQNQVLAMQKNTKGSRLLPVNMTCPNS